MQKHEKNEKWRYSTRFLPDSNDRRHNICGEGARQSKSEDILTVFGLIVFGNVSHWRIR